MLQQRHTHASALLAALLVLSCGKATPAPPSYTPTTASTKAYVDDGSMPYFGAPWPDDRRLNSDGTIPTTDFPNPGNGPLFDNVLQKGDHLIHGWGLASPVYVPFSAAIDPMSLPQSPTTDANASVFLVVIDPSSPFRGQRTFIDFHFYDQQTLFLPANVLAARPVPGFPLEPKTKYALVVTTGVKDTAGHPVAPDAAFKAALSGGAEKGFYQPLLDELDREKFDRSKVAGAVVFTTQPLLDDLLVLRDYILSLPAPQIEPGLHQATDDDLRRIYGLQANQAPPKLNFYVLQGAYPAPYMQHGVRPFLTDGGDFQFDANGKPIPAFTEDMRVTICVPKGPVPANGFPPVFYSHGTGGSFEDVVRDICPDLTAKGIVTFGIDQVFTGPRAGGATSCFTQPVEECFYNYVNPIAVRNNLRQAALDHFSLRRMASTLKIDPSLDPEQRTVTVDTSKIGFFGHSQGGLTGAIYSAIDPELWGSTLSGAGGHITTTLLLRKSPNAKQLAEGNLFLNIAGMESLEPYHPALALAQTIADIVDPLNFARYWMQRPNGRAKHIYATSGMKDPYTVPPTAEFMAIAAGLPQETPVVDPAPGFALAGLMPVTAPVTQDIMPAAGGTAVTGIFRQFPNADHFPAFDDQTARHQWAGFFDTMFRLGIATVPAPVTGN